MNNLILKILVYLWRTALIFPWRIQIIFGMLLGNILLIIPFKRNKFSKANIELCFPDKSEAERKKIYRRNILLSGRILSDNGIAWFWSDKRIKKNIKYEINGLSQLLTEQSSNKGILLFFKHSLHLELDTRILGMHAEIYGIERKHNSKYFQSIQKRGRLKSMIDVVDRKNTFKFMKWLKNGKTVLYAPDQDYGLDKSKVIKFFGHPAATVSAPYKIIQKTKCKTFFLNSYIKDNKLFLDIEKFNSNNVEEISYLNNLNKYIENKIKLNPDEYLWQHRRFKSTLRKIYK